MLGAVNLRDSHFEVCQLYCLECCYLSLSLSITHTHTHTYSFIHIVLNYAVVQYVPLNSLKELPLF